MSIGCASSDDTATSTDEINGGLPARNSPAVGLLVMSDGGLCTGTLVAPRWVLTAGHCASAITDFYTGLGAPAHDDHELGGRARDDDAPPDEDDGAGPSRIRV